MKKILYFLVFQVSVSLAQYQDTLIFGKWHLTKVIDNLTGNEIVPGSQANEEPYFIQFSEDSVCRHNLEVNRCTNEFRLLAKNQIKFLYYAECGEVCCDGEFSSLLLYEDCTAYYIKDKNTLLLVSEDRVYYFRREQ